MKLKVLFPVNPFEIEPPKITDEVKELVKKWDSVSDSVWDAVWDSVRDSVCDSVSDSVWDAVWDAVRDAVRDSVWDAVRDSVWDAARDSVMLSVWDSVRAYISSLFPNIKKWKYIDHEEGENPFQPAIDLWNMGLVCSFDGKKYRLYSKNGVEYSYLRSEL